MAERNDPYRLDSPAWHRRAAWFAEQLDRFVPFGTVHLRGLHYKLSSAGDVLLPDGRPYPNDDATWEWLNEKAAKAARWLGYVPFDRIIDERNAAPLVAEPEKEPIRSMHYFESGTGAVVPEPDWVLPRLTFLGGRARQRYRIILVGRKKLTGKRAGAGCGGGKC